MFWQMANPLRK